MLKANRHRRPVSILAFPLGMCHISPSARSPLRVHEFYSMLTSTMHYTSSSVSRKGSLCRFSTNVTLPRVPCTFLRASKQSDSSTNISSDVVSLKVSLMYGCYISTSDDCWLVSCDIIRPLCLSILVALAVELPDISTAAGIVLMQNHKIT